MLVAANLLLASAITVAAFAILFVIGAGLLLCLLWVFVTEVLIPLLATIFIGPFEDSDDGGCVRFWFGGIGLIVMVVGLLANSDLITLIGMVFFLLMVMLSILVTARRP